MHAMSFSESRRQFLRNFCFLPNHTRTHSSFAKTWLSAFPKNEIVLCASLDLSQWGNALFSILPKCTVCFARSQAPLFQSRSQHISKLNLSSYSILVHNLHLSFNYILKEIFTLWEACTHNAAAMPQVCVHGSQNWLKMTIFQCTNTAHSHEKQWWWLQWKLHELSSWQLLFQIPSSGGSAGVTNGLIR